MTIEDYIAAINVKRKRIGATPIEIFRRPGSTNPRVETIEIRLDNMSRHVLFKSQNWGSINIFLRGILTGFVDEVLPMPSSKPMDEATHRRLEL